MQGDKGLKGLTVKNNEQGKNAIFLTEKKLQIMMTCYAEGWKVKFGTWANRRVVGPFPIPRKSEEALGVLKDDRNVNLSLWEGLELATVLQEEGLLQEFSLEDRVLSSAHTWENKNEPSWGKQAWGM